MRIPLHPAGRREMVIITGIAFAIMLPVTAAAMAASPYWLTAGFSVLIVWVWAILFFRDPDRAIVAEPGQLLAPADGKLVELERVEQVPAFNGPGLKFGIFLSVFNVHINRSPCAGVVQAVRYKPGSFLDARDPRSGPDNEANVITITPDAPHAGPVIVRQIAGLIARRIVCDVAVGDRVEAGQRIGMIKFGSRTELIVPAPQDYVPRADIQDRVQAGLTVLAERTPVSQAAPHVAASPQSATTETTS